MKLSVELRLIVSDNLDSEIEREKKMSLDSRSLNVLEDKFFELMSKEGMSEEEAEAEVWKWWEERE